MKDKKYKRFGIVPFNRPVSHTDYQRIRRSPNPIKTADEMGIVDKKKIKDLIKLL